MEMRFLVDRLETIITNGRRMPFGRILLDEAELLEIVDQMHITEPTEINQARRVLLEREQILTQAQIEADSLLTMAKDRVEQLLSHDGFVQEAKAYAEQILVDSRQEAETLRAEAERYAGEILAYLDEALTQYQAQVRAGRERLRTL